MERIYLWENDVPLYEESLGQEKPSITPFLVQDGQEHGAMIVCPGGGYTMKCVDKEGTLIAEKLNRMGIHAFVLDYRVVPYHMPVMLLDAQRAIRYVRCCAKQFGVKADKIGIMGFSAGGHLTGMCGGLVQAGATLKSFYDPDPEKVEAFVRAFPYVHVAQSEEEILNDPEVKLVAAAAVTCRRAEIGCRVMRAGKDYWTDKAPMTTLEHVEMARKCVEETGRKYLCYFAERMCTESGVFADELIRNGAIGAITDRFEPVCHHAIGRTEGKIRPFQHGDVIFRVTGAHQDLLAQLLLQLTGSGDFGHTFGMDIDDAGCGAIHFDLVAPQFHQLCLGGIEISQFLRGAFKQSGDTFAAGRAG